MTAINRDKFLRALLNTAAPVPVAPLPSPIGATKTLPAFAKFMSQDQFAKADSTDMAVLGEEENKDREEGALSKTFGYLMAPMSTVENLAMDFLNPEKSDQSFGEFWKPYALDVAGGAAHLVQPLAEIAAVPGVNVPWEPEALSDFVTKQNTEYHGTGPIYGQRLLEERMGLDPKHNIRNALLGLGLDVAMDPLTYGTGGISALTKLGKAKLLAKALSGTTKVGETVTIPTSLVKPGKTSPVVDDILAAAAAKGKEFPAGTQTTANPLPEPFNIHTPSTTSAAVIGSRAPETGVGKIGGITPSALNKLKIALKLQDEMSPESLRSLQGVKAAETRWYDKLHPVVYPEKAVPKRPEFAGHEAAGADIVDNVFDEYSSAQARPLTRDDLVKIYEDVMDEVVNSTSISTKTVAEQKYIMKGVEDTLAERGYTFPEGKLSEYLHHTKDASPETLEAFARGKPLKERPEDLSFEDKIDIDGPVPKTQEELLAEANKARGRALLEAKLAKTQPGAVVTKYGINSRVVGKVIDAIANGASEQIYKIPKAQGADVVKEAIERAEKAKGMLGKTVGRVLRHKELNPANQANLFKQLYEGTLDIIKRNPELADRFRNKAGEVLHDTPAVRAWRRKTALSMLKTAEEHLDKTYGLKGQHWDGSGLRLSSVLEELGPDALDEHITKVLDAFQTASPSKVTDPIAHAAIVRAIARRKLETGHVAQLILDDYLDTAKIMRERLSHQKFLEWKNGPAKKKATTAAHFAGLTPEEVNKVVDLVKNQVNVEGLELMEPMQILDTLGKRNADAVLHGTADYKLIKRMGKALQDAMNETPKQQRLDLRAKTAFDTVMMNITTWYGRGEMIHYARSAFQALEDHAKWRAKWLSDKAKNYTKDEILKAFRIAQGHYEAIEAGLTEAIGTETSLHSERVTKLASQFKDYFENITGSSRTFEDMDNAAGSVAVRSQTAMKDINRHLRSIGSSFQFIDKGTKNVAGHAPAHGIGYGEGNWLLSWENVDATKLGQDPLAFLYDLDLAFQRVTTEYAMIDDFVMRFGRRPGDADFVQGVHTWHGGMHERIDPELRFPPEEGKAFTQLIQDLDKGDWIPSNKFQRAVVRYQRIWKTGVTQYSPSFHVRNAIGDAFLMWLAGHNNPIWFKKAAQMIAANKTRYKEAIESDSLDMLQGLINKEDYGVLQSTDDSIMISKHGADLTAAEIYGSAMLDGLLLDAERATDIIGDPLFANAAGRNPTALNRALAKPLGGYGHKAAMKTTEIREHSIRLAHYMSAINEKITPEIAKKLRKINADDTIGNKMAERQKVMQKIYDEAGQEVRKWHPDGRDLTHWEQKYARQVIPFYSWQRKIVPLLATAMLQRPAKLTAYPKGMFALQQAMGIDAPGIQDPFPQDQIYPDWMRAYGIGPVGDPESDNAVAAWWGKLGTNALLPANPITGIPGSGETGYTVVNPGNPFNDTVLQYGQTGGSIQDVVTKNTSMLSPFLALPAQLAFNQTWTGAPISKDQGGAGYPDWLINQLPVVSNAERVSAYGKEPKEGVEPGYQPEALIRFLTALGIRGTGQYYKSAEFDQKAAIKKLIDSGQMKTPVPHGY